MGLIPQARQGGRGVCSLAVVGSKLDGTGLEKLQMVHTHVAELVGGVSTGGARKGLCTRCAGEAFPLRDSWSDPRLLALGTKVILGEDLRKPAYIHQSDLVFDDRSARFLGRAQLRKTRSAQCP